MVSNLFVVGSQILVIVCIINIETIRIHVIVVVSTVHLNTFPSCFKFKLTIIIRDSIMRPSLDIYDLEPTDGVITAVCQPDGVRGIHIQLHELTYKFCFHS